MRRVAYPDEGSGLPRQGEWLTQTRGDMGQSLKASVVKSLLVVMATTKIKESVKKAWNPVPLPE